VYRLFFEILQNKISKKSLEAELSYDLRAILEKQAARDWVLDIEEPVSPIYTAARLIYDNQEKTVRLGSVKNYDCAVVAGVMGTREKIADAFGIERQDLTHFVKKCMDSPVDYMVVGAADFLSNVIEKPDLGKILPVLRFYPKGERRYFTSTIVAAGNRTAGTNFSFHRMMLMEKNRLSVRVVPRHLHAILESGGGKIPAVAFMGVHPAIEFASALSVEPEVEEAAVASRILGGNLRCIDMDGIIVPADAEIVMAGRFTGETGAEGPFVDLTSTYDDVRQQPVFEVDRLYLRGGFIYRTILPGGTEHKLLMGLPQESRMIRVISGSVPSVISVVLTDGGCGWLHAVVSIRKMAEGEGRNAGLAALAAHPSLKMVVVVDDDIDPCDPKQVEWAVATRLRPDGDIHVLPGMKGSTLDPSRNIKDDTSAKWILDATVPGDRNREAFTRVVPPPLE
jgi:2,5-furandicarboxylate decarboxylase 1